MTLKQLTSQLSIANEWKDSYNSFVPSFIKEATSNDKWENWEPGTFYEFFERSTNQCVSSLQQGYFNKDEQRTIKNNWAEIGPLLKQIAVVQNVLQIDVYKQLADTIKKYTSRNMVAATNRLIAAIQPELLCTIVDMEKLDWLIYFLNTHIEGCSFDSKETWYEKSNAVLNYFTTELQQPAMEIMTLPWQVYQHFKSGKQSNTNDMNESQIDLQETIELLKYKKQIILQGPPGTGKTKLALEIGKKMTIPSEISEKIILDIIKPDTTILAPNKKDKLRVIKINSTEIVYERPADQKGFRDSLSDLIWSYKTKSYEKQFSTLNFKECFVKHIHDQLHSAEQLQIVQFHPSFTYEDFVRGIVVKPNDNGDGLLYEPENKTLGSIAQIALKNYLDSQKDSSVLSYENWIREKFEEFVFYLDERLDTSNTVPLTDKVNISQIEKDAFRYQGNTGWSHQMKFEDLIKAKIDNNTTRQHVKRNANLSGLANWHATYFHKTLSLFDEFITEKKYRYVADRSAKVPLKNYVLIIDEINRANLSSVLGELIYAMEYRGDSINSVYSSDQLNGLVLPPNLYIIGTMNTADRSVGTIDYAIRRRFAFIDVEPKDLSVELGDKFAGNLFKQVSELFDKNYSQEFDPKDIRLGHSYFIEKEEGGTMARRLEYEIKPILLEYVKDGILIGNVDEKSIKEYIKNDLKIT